MNLRFLAAAGLLVVGVGAVGLAVFQPGFGAAATDDYVTATASVTDVVDEAVANGTIAAARIYGLTFGADPHLVDSTDTAAASGSSAWLVQDVSVAVGQKVSTRDVLATADTAGAQLALELAQANLDAAQARYDTDTGGATDTERDEAQISVDQAQQQLQSARQSRDETARENKIKLKQAREAVDDAQAQLNDDRDANAPDNVIDADKGALAAAQDSLALQKIQVESSNRQAEEQVESAQLSLQSANNNYNSQVSAATDEQIASDRAALLQAQQAVAEAQAQLDGAVITAPVDGTILAVDIVAGFSTSTGEAFQLMANGMQVTAEFSESDLPSIALGQTATITVSATDSEISGTVSAIAQSSSSSGASSVVSYPVTITLNDVPEAVRPGMSAQVAVTVAEALGVVAVPSTALLGGAGNYSVRVFDSARSVTVRSVQVGLVTSGLAEITSGLDAGESVVTGTTSSPTGGNGGGFFPGGGGGFNGPPGGGGVVTNGGGPVTAP
jgi:RND family efflux transporter MFP subunit